MWPPSHFRFGMRGAVTALIFLLLAASLQAQRPGARGRGVPEIEELTREEAYVRMEHVRNQRLIGAYAFDFVLKDMPRRARTQIFSGTLWGEWQGGVPRFRLRLYYPAGSDQTVDLLVVSGSQPQAWFGQNAGSMKAVAPADLFAPVLPELDYTIFDLSMSFLYWERFTYVGSDRSVRGQPAYIFDMYPPSDLPADIGRVRVTLHASYNALMRAEVFDREDKHVKELNLLSFKEVQEQWIVREMDYINVLTHDKSRFSVLRAALNIDLPQGYFQPTWTGGYVLPRVDHWEVVQ